MPPRAKLIGVGGPMGSGKTFFVETIQKALGDHCKVVTIASPLYDVCKTLGMRRKDRAFLQKVGAALRSVDEDIFIKAAVQKVLDEAEEMKDERSVVVVDGIRFENEVLQLNAAGVETIYLDIPHDVRIERLKQTYPENWQEHVDRLTDPAEQVYSIKHLFKREADGRMTPEQILELAKSIKEGRPGSPVAP